MKQIKEYAVKVLGMTDEEVQSLFKTDDDGNENLAENFAEVAAEKDRARLERIQNDHKEQLTKIHDKGYQKAQKEVMPKFESEIKKKYGYDTDKIGIDLIDDIVQSNKANSDIKDVKTHPDYIKLERKLESDFIPKDKFEEISQQFDQFKSNVEREKVVGRVKEDARKVFKSLNPLLSKDPKRAANQEAEFLRKFESFDYQLQDDGNHVILAEGKRLENANYNPKQFGEFVKEKASEIFDFADQNSKGNSGVSPSGSESSGNFAFKDGADFQKQYDAEPSAEKRVKMFESAKKQKII